MLQYRPKNNVIVDTETGEIYSSSVKPKFQGLSYEDYRATFKKNKSVRFIKPMKAQELIDDKLEAILSSEDTVAEKKWDGHRTLMYTSKEANRIFSGRVSDASNWFSENTDQVPHIRDTIRVNLAGTVLDAEITLPIQNCTCRDVQGVTGALPDTALKTQIERGFAELNAFDILYYKGLNVQHFPYWKRKMYLLQAVNEFNVPFIKMCTIFATKNIAVKLAKLWKSYDKELGELLEMHLQLVPSYRDLFNKMIEEGDEGIILKNLFCKYKQGVSKDFVKMKGHNTYDCIIMGYEDPTEAFDGKTDLKDWKYWKDSNGDIYTSYEEAQESEYSILPVTKFYALNWIGALYIGVWKTYTREELSRNKKLNDEVYRIAESLGDFTIMEDDYTVSILYQVGRCSGLDDETRDEISKHKKQYLGAVIEVEAQKIINGKTGSLQHPRMKDWRPDKNSEECSFDAHVRKYDEEDN